MIWFDQVIFFGINGDEERATTKRSYYSGVGSALGANPRAFTSKEIAEELGAALAAPPSADSAAKGKFKFAESRRKMNEEKRKNFKELLDFD